MAVSSTKTIPYEERVSTFAHPLSAYLLRLMVLKRSNLCLSADVSSAQQLLELAAAVGPSIVILKTHYDIVSDWDAKPHTGTAAQLAALARQHGFLIFEDRKYSDIGSTVQKQYTAGPARVVEWAHITNAHILPGEAIVTSLAEAAKAWKREQASAVQTAITTGTDASIDEDPARRGSIYSVTTVSQHVESSMAANGASSAMRFPGIEEPPRDRALLLLAQMSSAGNLLDAAYTTTCVNIARNHKNFVMGYIAQQSLNTDADDHFLSMTPGCQLPPPGEEKAQGDGMGQQYNTPQRIIGEMGNDIVIVGRGIIQAADPEQEAERYRKAGWAAYEARIS